MKQILIPIDFTERCWNTLYCAICHFRQKGTTFYLFHVEAVDQRYTETENDLVLHKNLAAHQQLAQWEERANKITHPDQQIRTIASREHFIKALRLAVKEYAIDLIAMSTHQPNVFQDSVLGSYTREVLTRVKCPVLIVPSQVQCPVPKQMALVTDFNFRHNAQAVSAITQVVAANQAHLHILNLSKKDGVINERQSQNKSFLQDAFDSISHSFHFVINKTMDEALQFFINVQHVELVILFAKNMNFSESLLFSPSLDATIDYHKKVPFLIVHE